MFKTLRNRLILSHVLPLLIIIPLMGIALIYVLETRFLLPNLARALTGEAMLLAEVTRQETQIWDQPTYAQDLLNRVSPNLRTRIMFIEPGGELLASSDPADKNRTGQVIKVPDLAEAVTGQVITRQNYYSPSLQAEVIDVLVPVIDPSGQLLGIIRMTYQYATVSQEFLQMRFFIAGILVLGLISGAALGYVLAMSIGTPVQKVTRAVYDLASGSQSVALTEHGPEEIRLLLRAVNYLVERLRTMEQSRHRLLANLVHELGRPLGAIRSAIQALMQGADEDPELLDELLIGMEEETMILQRLLDDLAQIHDQILGTLELEWQPLALSDWLPTALRTWQEAAKDKRIRWEMNIPSNLPTIQADPVRLAQVVGNLTSNAIKFTPVSGSVSISAGTEKESVWICISDTGPGISIEEQQKIFTPYYRGNQGRRFPQGMGLGLSIARDLIVAHGGKLEIDSTPGMGSRFTVWLPIKAVTVSAPA